MIRIVLFTDTDALTRHYDVTRTSFGGNISSHLSRKMAMCDENIEKLIDLVRENPSLYNPTDPFYKDVQRTKNAWVSIGKRLNISGKQLFYVQKHFYHEKFSLFPQPNYIQANHIYIIPYISVNILSIFSHKY